MTLEVGPAAAAAGDHPVVRRIAQLAVELLAPTAAESDQRGVPRSHLDALAGAGAMGVWCPTEFGGSDGSADVVREVVELIAGACGTTWFCFAQHKTPTALLLASANARLREQWLRRLVAGEAIGSAAFAHLRRAHQSFAMTRVAGGWRLDGSLDWITTWPISDVAVIQGFGHNEDGSGRDEVVSVFVTPPRPDPSTAPGLTAGPRLQLAAMAGTHTWPVSFDGFVVPDAFVCSVIPTPAWRAENTHFSADSNPAVFGMVRATVVELAEVAEKSGQPYVAQTAIRLCEELTRLRARAYELADAAAADRSVSMATMADRIEIRAAALELNVRAANSLVAATGGTAMMLCASPQRRAREALFLLVQGQTSDLRAATLRLLGQ